jgi:hypothetical protein
MAQLRANSPARAISRCWVAASGTCRAMISCSVRRLGFLIRVPVPPSTAFSARRACEFPSREVDDRLVLAGVALALVNDLAAVDQVGVAAVLGQPAHIAEILLLGISAEVDLAQLV